MKKFLLALLLFGSASCSHYSVAARVKYADNLAASSNFRKSIIATSDFPLLTYSRISSTSRDRVDIYIEGDGMAWKNYYTISDNPTPINPIALKLALVDQSPNVIYLARPCQYINLQLEPKCSPRLWSDARFSQEVVNALNQVIQQLVTQYHFKEINLFGYSGGGTLAVLVAAQRQDVKLIKTVAANLNHKEFTKLHHVTPLYSSLDAIDVADKVKNIEQFHFIGGSDHVVPSAVIISFVKRVNEVGGNAKFKVITGIGHNDEKWIDIWRTNFRL